MVKVSAMTVWKLIAFWASPFRAGSMEKAVPTASEIKKIKQMGTLRMVDFMVEVLQ